MNSVRSSQVLKLNWTTSLKVQHEAAQDQQRWFSREGSAYFAALVVFGIGSSCWPVHAAAMTIFGSLLAGTALLRIGLEGGAARRSSLFTSALWAALGCWTAFAQLPLSAQFIYLLLTAAFAAAATRGLASDLRFARRYQAVLLAPAIVAQLVAGRFGGSSAAYGLAGTLFLFGVFMTIRAGQFNAEYWESVTSRAQVEAKATELEQARHAGESSQEIQHELLAKVSEESQAPLKGVARMTAMLLETPVTPDQRELLEIIRDSTNMLRHTMNNLTAFCEWNTDSAAAPAPPALEIFEPERVLDGVAAMFEAKAAAKSLEIRTVAGPGLTRAVLGDPQRIGQALANLVANAIKFTEHGYVEVFADCRAGVEKAELLFEVRDTGIGMAPQKRATLFDRASHQGLGLLIADTIAEQMGGRISAESTLGEGSRFRLTLCVPFAPGDSRKKQTLDEKQTLQEESVLVRV